MGKDMVLFGDVKSAMLKVVALLEKEFTRPPRIPRNRVFAELTKITARLESERDQLCKLSSALEKSEAELNAAVKQDVLKGGQSKEIERIEKQIAQQRATMERTERNIKALEELRATNEVQAREKRIAECKVMLQQMASVSEELTSAFLKSPAEGTLAWAKESFEKAYAALGDRVSAARDSLNDQIRADQQALAELRSRSDAHTTAGIPAEAE